MSDKSNFTPEEWKLLLESVMMAGIAVTAAEPSGLWGLLKESFASGGALRQAQLDPGSRPLIKAVVADFETSEGQRTARDGLREKLAQSKPADIKTQCMEILRQARGLVEAKASDDAAGFKEWAPPNQPARRRGIQRRRISRHRWSAGERNGKGYAHRDLKCARADGLILARGKHEPASHGP
jgi:hypothetical protein